MAWTGSAVSPPPAGAQIREGFGGRRTSEFLVRVFRTADGYLAWIDGIGTVEGRTLAETRREARTFLRTVLGGAFPDRPEVDLEGTAAVLRYSVDVRLRRGRPRAPGAARSAPRAAAPGRQNGRRP